MGGGVAAVLALCLIGVSLLRGSERHRAALERRLASAPLPTSEASDGSDHTHSLIA